MMNMGLSIIIVNYGRSDLVLNFLHSIQKSADSRLVGEVIIVDNGYLQKGNSKNNIDVSSFSFNIKFLQNIESSYASGINRGASLATGEIFILANNDIELLQNSSIWPLVDNIRMDTSIGIVGPQQVYADGTWQKSYGRFPSLMEVLISLSMLDSIGHSLTKAGFYCNWSLLKKNKKVDYIDGAFMAIRRRCFEELGGFDEEYSFYGEDADFCWRAWKAGWKVIFVPKARVIHIRGASSAMKSVEDYTVRLFKAKCKFVQNHKKSLQAKWYYRLYQAVFFERMLFYRLLAKITRKVSWQRKANLSLIRYKAIKEWKEHGRNK